MQIQTQTSCAHEHSEAVSLRELSSDELDVVAGGNNIKQQLRQMTAGLKWETHFNAKMKELCGLGDAFACSMSQ